MPKVLLKTRAGRQEHSRRITLYNRGWCDSQIASALGVTRGGVFAWRKKHKLKANVTKGGLHIERSGNNKASSKDDPRRDA